jgi:BirA family biotin operon repressor/biotin-[acetyl-CoA-carboxylase] ligase
MNDALDVGLIYRAISQEARQRLDRLDVLDEVPSTNTWLMDKAGRIGGRFEVAFAEHQTAGRGRFSRTWHSPPHSGLCMSMAYTFATGPALLSCLSLVVGVAVAQALERLGAHGHRLKWPNDIMARDGKLGGILTDALTGKGNSITAVVGVGLNIDLGNAKPDDGLIRLDRDVTDLRSCIDELPPRSVVAAALIEDMQRAILQFETEGLKPYREAWNTYDWLKGRNTIVEMPHSTFNGVADGIDSSGALRILTEHGRRRVFTGSVRPADGGAADT